MVLGLCIEGKNKAYPFGAMPDGAVINDVLGGRGIAILFSADSHTAIAYFNEVDGRALSFYAVEPEGDLPIEFVDVETGSRWNMLGSAIEGPLAGQQLKQVPSYNSMWFAWAAYWPDTALWSGKAFSTRARWWTRLWRRSLRSHRALCSDKISPTHLIQRRAYTISCPRTGPSKVYNSSGQVVRALVDGVRRSGIHRALMGWTKLASRSQWDGYIDWRCPARACAKFDR